MKVLVLKSFHFAQSDENFYAKNSLPAVLTYTANNNYMART